MTPGRYCALHGRREWTPSELRAGLDFRCPEYRRAVFLMFYRFHLKYRAHPGCIYYVIPCLWQRLGWDTEQAFWFAFLNGNTQNPVTSLVLMSQFPTVEDAHPAKVRAYLDAHWSRLEFDIDRRYWKVKLPDAIGRYRMVLGHLSQRTFFAGLQPTADPLQNFRPIWNTVREEFLGFGRMSGWSYSEYLRIVGVNVQADSLMLWDRDGSRSHRNGLCKVLGRDDLDWHDGNPDFDGRYPQPILDWLETEVAALLKDAEAYYPHPDLGLFTLESTLCTYKSWHRPNRRYPNVYNDMFHDRIRRAERVWAGGCPVDLNIFWDIRAECLPAHLRLECNPGDPGLTPEKQNHYRLTGEPVMMDEEYPCFQNRFNQRAREEFALRSQ